MGFDIIEDRLRTVYGLDADNSSPLILEHALKEMMQEISLRGLALSGFFKRGTFHGGTCLRIMHRMPRFSEDLDFTLSRPDPSFRLAPYLDAVGDELKSFDLELSIRDKGKPDVTVTKHMIAAQSVGKLLNIESRVGRRKNIRIKVEVDTNPPAGQVTEAGAVIWPSAFSIIMQDIPTLFAGKLHALLCRTYEKGRDWHDLIWYAQRKASINFSYLKNALVQTGDLKEDENVDMVFVKAALKKKLESVNLQNITEDVAPLVSDRRTVDYWTKEIFTGVIDSIG